MGGGGADDIQWINEGWACLPPNSLHAVRSVLHQRKLYPLFFLLSLSHTHAITVVHTVRVIRLMKCIAHR
jgi:hypothetical protein